MPDMRRRLRVAVFVILGAIILFVVMNQLVDMTGNSFVQSQNVRTSDSAEKVSGKNQITWSDSEKQMLNNIALSYAEVEKADAILAVKTPETLTSEDLAHLISAFQQGLSYAESVPDSVLDKMHPQMKAKFRTIYQPGLLRMLNGFANANQVSAREGAELYHQYLEWALSHSEELAYPTK